MNHNPGIEIHFENKEFRHCKDAAGDMMFDTWVLKSPGNKLVFKKEHFIVTIITAKFPHGFYGFGYKGTRALGNESQCYCHGALGGRTFKTEFEAQCAAINYVLKNEIITGWHQHFIKLQMQDFVNPKTLF